MRQVDRRRHIGLGLAAGETEHDPLIAGPFVLVAAGIDTLGNVGRLRVEVIFQRGMTPVEPFLLVADHTHRFARGPFDQIAGN